MDTVSSGVRSSLRRWYSPIVIIALWQAGSMLGLIPARIIAAPAAIVVSFWTLLVSGQLLGNLGVSLGRVAAGVAIGVLIGAGLAVLAGLSRRGEDVVDPPLQMLRTLPLLGLTPLLILWFGIGELPKILLIVLATTFPVYLTLLGGIRAVDPKLIEAGRIFGLSRWGIVQHVIVPGALPSALVGLRYALGTAWVTLVVGEQINADKGLGYLIMDARDFLRTDVIVVCLLVYAILGLGTDALVRAVERRALAWRPAVAR
ncbi:MAG: ABC transporter permease [Vulcanimicrobiaceae bacterium]